MNKPLSTFERQMKNPTFKKYFGEGYQKLLLSELMISIMEGDDISIRNLVRETVKSSHPKLD